MTHYNIQYHREYSSKVKKYAEQTPDFLSSVVCGGVDEASECIVDDSNSMYVCCEPVASLSLERAPFAFAKTRKKVKTDRAVVRLSVHPSCISHRAPPLQ